MLTEVVEGFQLSLQQEHLWLLQKSTISQTYNQTYRAQCAVLIEGNLDPNTLTAALQDVINRHEILRTTFRCLPGMTIPVQVITNHQVLLEQKYNLSDCISQEQENRIEAIFHEIGQIPFNFEQGSLLHTSLVTLSLDRHILLVSMPAMLADSATLNNLVGDLSCSYSACLQGQELSDKPLQYADFSEWQNELQEADETEIGREYWQKQDLSAIFHLKLPEDRNQPNQPEFKPQFITSKIISHQIAEIEAITRKYNSAVSIFLLACWQVLIWRLTQQSDIIVGTACAGRNYQEMEEALGLFARYLPLHCHLENNLSFRKVLQNIDESVLSISRWQDCFNWQENLDVADKYNDLLFCPFCFNFEEEATKYCEGDVSFSIYKQFTCIDRFKIKLSGRLQDNSIIVDFHYDPYQFGAEDIERLLDQFHQLVKSAIKNPEAAISKLEILSDHVKHQLLVQFNQTQADYPQDKCIHHLFQEQAERTPNNIAVAFENLQLTYTELNARANQLAYYLQKLGVKSEVLVGICVERSLEMIVGILGILKAGGAYVPLDPAYPQERLTLMLEDAQTSVLLTQQHLLEGLPAHNARTICLDIDWEIIAQENKENLTLRISAENLAYVIYTSGSTGKPKGVQIAHQNLVHSTTARIAYYQERVTSFLLLSSFAFDSSVAGIFWTLCSGGILYLPQEGLQREVPKLLELIDQNHISHLLTLPSLYALLLEQAKPEQLISLRTLIVAGEACPTELVQRHLKLSSETSLFNEYGPTEGTVWSSVYHCCSSKLKTQVPIGRPIANTQIYLLDSHLHPVPLGVPGEVHISGNGIARGYFNCPDVTAEKFIPNPLSEQVGSHLYKTGDLARYLLDGNIEFLGRIDHQVKIRGYRIELGEVEAVLSQHPRVQSLAVIAREDELGHKRLVAYVVPHPEQSPNTSDLRRFLQDKLPEYMMPSAFVLLKNLPLTPNGKVDRFALPLPDTARPDIENTYVAPRTPVEKNLAEIWSEVLRLERVGVHDNFFDLGGHSLLVTQVVSRLRDAFEVDLPLRDLFDKPTIADLAVTIAQQLAQATDSELLTQTFAQLEQLSQEEVQAILAGEQQ